MVSLTSAAAGIEFCRSADSRRVGNSERSKLFLDTGYNHQHGPDRHKRESDQLESESSQRDGFYRQQFDDSIHSELDYYQRHKFSRRKSKQHEPDWCDGNLRQHECSRQQLGQSEFAQFQQPELE
jgi:hypothetical protein